MAAQLTASQKQFDVLQTIVNTTDVKAEVLHTRLSTTEVQVQKLTTESEGN